MLVADDLMDSSVTRRGRPCWHTLQSNPLSAINDSFLLWTCCLSLLQDQFSSSPCYPALLDTALHNMKLTAYGQCLDLQVGQQACGQPDSLNSFDMETYATIAKYKTSFSLFLPICLAMQLAGIEDMELHEAIKTVLFDIGHYYQVINDYNDCYGDPAGTGKIGTDIQDGKCSWLIVKALQAADEGERRSLALNYGLPSPENTASVKSMFSKLKIEHKFKDYEKKTTKEIFERIDKVCAKKTFPAKIFTALIVNIKAKK